MNNDNSLQASFWVMVLLQTLGSVDMPGSGPRKMPSPRSYLSVLVVWAVLELFADTGGGRERGASIAGWIIVLTGMVVGPFGAKVTNLFSGIVNLSGASSSQTSTTSQGG